MDVLESLNVTHAQIECLLRPSSYPEGTAVCATSFDPVLCWPETPAGTLAVQPCFEEFNFVKYDTNQNASRWCHSNGTWDNYANYSLCREKKEDSPPPEYGVETISTLYFAGYSLSLVALVIAVWIFLYFKDLRCLRNTIHTNLMFTYILADFTWILTTSLQISVQFNITSCVLLILLLHYFFLTNFFWMFVEGLYLYMLVVETFTSENIKLRVYVFIGWGVPVFIVTIWGLVKSYAPLIAESQAQGIDPVLRDCVWMRPDSYDWINHAPVLALLAINTIFLVIIMWVLITKLRSANTVETQQYRKATKALLVLIPLLGITYILVIAGPTEGLSASIYAYIRALLLSTQGFTVALFYCFLNTEVQNTVRHHLERWKTSRSLGGSRRYNYSKDWSPRSRTESIRLYSSQHQPLQLGATNYKKRESTASETTMTTLVGNGRGLLSAENAV